MSETSKPIIMSGAPPLPPGVATPPSSIAATQASKSTLSPKMIVKPINDSSRLILQRMYFPQTIFGFSCALLLAWLLCLIYPPTMTVMWAIVLLAGIVTALNSWRTNSALPGGYSILKPFSKSGSSARLMFFVGLSVLPYLALMCNNLDWLGIEGLWQEERRWLRATSTVYLCVVLPITGLAYLQVKSITGVTFADMFSLNRERT